MKELVFKLQLVPYVAGGKSWAGADCWGLVEMWYKSWLNVDLPDRADIQPGPAGLSKGFTRAKHWQRIIAPEDHALAIMRSRKIKAGHVGIVWKKSVLHTEEGVGCTYQKLDSRAISSRITCFLRYMPL